MKISLAYSFVCVLCFCALLVGCEKKAAKAPAAPPLIQIAEVPSAQPVTPVAEPMPTPEAPVEKEQVKADVGVGIKGRALDEHEGMVVTPVKGLFAAKEMIAFEIMVPQALQLYAATEGNYPKTHQEFWEKVIVANQLESQLPQLPEGHRYVYDPAKKELMVERPKGWKFTPKE